MRVETVPIRDITVPRPRLRGLRLDELEGLAESIDYNGMLQRPVVNESYEIVFGLHRVEAVRRHLGWENIEVEVRSYTELEAMLAEIDENYRRVDLLPSEIARHVMKREQIIEAMGLRRKRGRPRKETNEVGPGSGKQENSAGFAETMDNTRGEGNENRPGHPPDPLREVDSQEVRAATGIGGEGMVATGDLADSLGMSNRLYRTYNQIAKNIPSPILRRLDATPIGRKHDQLLKFSRRPVLESPSEVREGEKRGQLPQAVLVALLEERVGRSVEEVERNYQRAKTAELASSLHEPTGRYRTIVVDPPWAPEISGDSGGPNGKIAPGYATLTLDKLKELDVAGLAEPDDCHLYLWVTGRTLREGFELLDVWGFNYVQPLVWVKNRMGVGRYYRNRCEFVLFATRGTRVLATTNEENVIYDKRRGHSEKPDQFYDMVRRCSPGPRIDVFARQAREGFDGWGDEANMETMPQGALGKEENAG